jgi:hypothetical protein
MFSSEVTHQFDRTPRSMPEWQNYQIGAAPPEHLRNVFHSIWKWQSCRYSLVVATNSKEPGAGFHGSKRACQGCGRQQRGQFVKLRCRNEAKTEHSTITFAG